MLEKTGVFIEDSKFGGPQRLLVNIFKEKKLKKKIKIFLSKENNLILKKKIKKNNIDFCEINICWLKKNFNGILFFLFNFIFDVFKFIKKKKKNNLSQIYIFGGASNIRTLIASKILKKKIIWHLHEVKISIFLKYIFIILYSDNIKFIFSSYSCKKFYTSFITIKNYIIIPSGISIKKNIKNIKLKKINKKITISNVSNINEDKNLEFFIKVANYFVEKNKNFFFKIYGNVWPNKFSYFNKIKKLIINKKQIKIIKGIDNLNIIHRSTDIYLCTSKNESSPLAVWEAMSLGIVVLSAPAGDLRLEIKNNINGFLINEYDMHSFCKKLNWIIKNHHKLNKLRKNAILSMKQKHDIKNISSQILNNFF